MTTELSKSAHPRLPRPDRYTAYLEQLEARCKKEEKRKRVWSWLAIAVAAVLMAIGLAGIYYGL